MKPKAIFSLMTIALALSISASAEEQPAQHAHAHVLSHVAKFTYNSGKEVAKETGKAVAYAAKQIV